MQIPLSYVNVLHQILHTAMKGSTEHQQSDRGGIVNIALALFKKLDLAKGHAGIGSQLGLRKAAIASHGSKPCGWT